jgi:hypothetical protein
MPSPVLLLAGWHNSGPDHWQSHWQRTHGFIRVAQHDWDFPLRGDWMAQLEEAVLRYPHAVLVAHGLGCLLVAAWAAHSQHVHLVDGALLVAPCDIERLDMQHRLHSWHPMPQARLPFKSIVAASRNDPYCSLMRASGLAQTWGSQLIDCGVRGHLNADAGLGDWSQGFALLQDLQKEEHGH